MNIATLMKEPVTYYNPIGMYIHSLSGSYTIAKCVFTNLYEKNK